jgi:hypothetical protein
MQIDALIVGLVVLVVCGAAFFYLYMRISFYERKGSMMESVIVDLKMAIDSLMSTGFRGGASIPVSPAPEDAPVQLSGPVPLEMSESEPIPEESFYSSVLEQAHEEVETSEDATITVGPEIPADANTEFETMTKNDLLAEAEKRGLRARKNMNRTDLLTLLRRSVPLPNTGMTAGAENVSGSAAALDGSVVDLGQDATSLE